jgi:1,4-alpha-glucan branching enzyme
MWRLLHEAAVRMKDVVGRNADLRPGGIEDRALRQAARELLLAQASDWPFIITNGTTEQYARRRFFEHLNRFHDLLNSFEQREIHPEKLEALEYLDNIFPEVDYRLFGSAC